MIVVATALLILFSSLNMTDFFHSYMRFTTLSLCLFIILGFFIRNKEYKLIVNWKIFTVIYFFTLFGLLSALFNSDDQVFIGIMGIFLVFVSLTVITPMMLREDTVELITKIIFLTHIPLIVWSLLNKPIQAPFQGIFYNPNAFGTVVGTLYSLNLALYLNIMENGKVLRLKPLLYLLSLTSLFLLVMLSGSRTSLITAAIVSVFGLFLCLMRLFKKGRLIRFTNATILGTALIYFAFIAMKSIIPPHLYAYIIYKFQRSVDSGDVLSGRRYIWKHIMENTSLFGGGSNYLGSINIGAHNTFLGLLGEYGILTAVSFLLFLFIGYIYSIRYAFRSDDFYKYVPILMLLTFTLMSVGEDMMHKLSMYTCFILIGYVSTYRYVMESNTFPIKQKLEVI